jgi:molybdopterin molybdotransferase
MALLSVAEAHARLMRLFAPLPAETVPLIEAAGRVLARDAVATRDQPPFPAAAMDGYAVRAADAAPGARLRVTGQSAAGRRFDGAVGPGEAVRIFTGAPVPDGADLVVIQEDVRRDGDAILLGASWDPGPHVRPAASDFAAGNRIAAPRRLRSSDVALLAAMNLPLVEVARRPVVALIATGDELVMPGEAPGPDQIVSSNNIALGMLLEQFGAEARLLPIARDTAESLAAAFELAAGADAIVTLGGASVGEHDLVRQTAMEEGMELDFYRIAMRPGKPLMAGRLRGVPLVGLPGNPVSAIVCGHVFLRPAIDRMLGLEPLPAAVQAGRLGRALEVNGPRQHYMRATVVAGQEGWVCTPSERQDSALLSVLSESNALMVRPPADPPRQIGDAVEFFWI